MRAHCYNIHGWGLEPQQGQAIVLKEGEMLPWEEEVPAQRLRDSGKASGLWRVSLPSRGDRDSPSAKAEPSLST